MNQILQVQEKKSKKINKTIDTKKIVLFFSICIIIFGSIMLAEGAYAIYQEKANQKVEPEPNTNPGELVYLPPNISLRKTEENKVVIKVDSDVEISHIIYDWNNEASQTIEESGKTNIEETIDIPLGTNTLNITVIDSNGKETKKTETFIVEAGKPDIKLSAIGTNLKITVTSEYDLSYITYKWNSETEQKFDMHTYEDKTKFEKTIEIPKGQNTLKIIAVDENEVKAEHTMQIEGIPPAKTRTIVKGEYIYFTVTSEIYNIETVEFELNGKQYKMDTNTFGITKEVKYKVKMAEGWNYLKVESKLQKINEDIRNTTLWKFEYIPQ